MKRKCYTEEKIISILKEHEAGASAAALSRRHGVAENSIYRARGAYTQRKVITRVLRYECRGMSSAR